MRRAARRWLIGVGAVSSTIGMGLLIGCLKDPRDGEPVVSPSNCDVSKLDTDPAKIDATLKTYVEASRQMVEAARAADVAMRDACLEIYKDPALKIATPVVPPEAISQAAEACAPLVQRMSAKLSNQPPAQGLNVVPGWIQLSYGIRCDVAPGAREACLAACAGACDVSKCESEDKIAGTCAGDCLGTCTKVATDSNDPDGGVVCKGQCIGEVTLSNPALCQGECIGTCSGGFYNGDCAGTCAKGFTGRCTGTCYGSCEKDDLGGFDAGPQNLPDGAAPPQDPPKPTNTQPGNCGLGKCIGSCSEGATGSCYGDPATGLGGRCVNYTDTGNGTYTTAYAPFKAGQCTNAQCTGVCRSAVGTGAVSSFQLTQVPEKCRGECTELTIPPVSSPLTRSLSCPGTCRKLADSKDPACSTGLEPGTTTCDGALRCGQNVECNNACEAKVALEAKCLDPLVMQVYAASDPELYNALQAHGAALGKAVAELQKVQKAYSFIGNRNYGDFIKLRAGEDGGAGQEFPSQGELATICAAEGASNAKVVGGILNAASLNDPTTVRASTSTGSL